MTRAQVLAKIRRLEPFDVIAVKWHDAWGNIWDVPLPDIEKTLTPWIRVSVGFFAAANEHSLAIAATDDRSTPESFPGTAGIADTTTIPIGMIESITAYIEED